MTKTKTDPLPEFLVIEIDGAKYEMFTFRYVAMKVQQLRDFGYPHITSQDVCDQLSRILANKKLSVIGEMMKGEVIGPASARQRYEDAKKEIGE